LYVQHDAQLQDPYVSPVFAEETEVEISPMLIHVGGAERVRDDAIYFTHRFANSMIRLEVYEEMVHVFQLFTPFHAFSKLSLSRMGSFLFAQTGRDGGAGGKRETLFVENRAGFPVSGIDDCVSVLTEGVDVLVERGVYRSEERNGVRLVSVAGRRWGFVMDNNIESL
jgi:alpha/beta hydrolase fold